MDSCHNPVDPTYIGPYKATRVWNDVISAFRQYLPCGRHRRYMKTFDNCFSGSSAVDWLLHYLKGSRNFNDDVSREKALSLLNKLYKAGIFEEVKVTKNMRHKQDVQENRLYKFLPASPSKMKIFRLPLAPRNDADVNRFTPKDKLPFHHKHDKQEPVKASLVSNAPEQNKQSKLTRKLSILKKEKLPKNPELEQAETYPPCRLISRVLTTREIKETWKTVFIQRLKKTLGVSRLGDIISLEDIDGYNIMHNCIYLNKSGIVTNIDCKDQLPQWVMSAMRCLARWPEPPEPGLPSYPGFEKDVFGVVKDYFLGLEEPLIPFSLYDVITNVFVMAGNNQPRHSSPHHGTEEESSGATSLWTSASLENIILNLTKKYCLLENTEPHYTSNLELKPSSISRQWYGTQEELRFVSHMDRTQGSYNNRTAFPSTDGMDILSQSNKHSQAFSSNKDIFSKLHSHETHKLLSRTTRSAAEVFNGSNLNKTGILRKFGSTPNLKVSRYETAFGPDNRTVTRVFYQNGMTTDFGHEDDEESSCLNTDTEKACGEVKQSFHEKGISEGCGFVNEQEGSHSPHKSFTKSKSCIDITGSIIEQDVLENSLMHNINFGRSNGMNSSFDGASGNQRTVHSKLEETACKPYMTQVVETEEMLQSRSLNRGDFVTLQHKTVTLPLSNLVEAYGPGYRPSSYINQEEDLSETDRHEMKGSEPVESCAKILTPQKNLDSWTPYKTSHSLSNFGPGFKPAVRRTQKRYSTMAATESIPDLSSAQHDIDQDYYPISTPNLNLSHITPFCSTRQKTGDFSRTNFINFPQNRLSEDRAKNSLQMVSLLLPPSSRRKLHLLFKMMVKMTSNPNLCLDPTQTTRSLVLGTFYPAIIRCQEECDLDELVVLQLVSFMLDFFDDIFNPPVDIKSQVSERLKIMQRPQVVYSPRPERTVRFCQQTTIDDFENQRTSTSQSALEQLLEGIIADGNINIKEKKKHLKQFQRTYPTIYTLRFPNPESESAIFPPKTHDKPSLKVKSLSRLKGLRL